VVYHLSDVTCAEIEREEERYLIYASRTYETVNAVLKTENAIASVKTVFVGVSTFERQPLL